MTAQCPNGEIVLVGDQGTLLVVRNGVCEKQQTNTTVKLSYPAALSVDNVYLRASFVGLMHWNGLELQKVLPGCILPVARFGKDVIAWDSSSQSVLVAPNWDRIPLELDSHFFDLELGTWKLFDGLTSSANFACV